MEKILVAMNGRYGAWEALSHACSLARRMDIQLNVLLVTPAAASKASRPSGERQIEEQVRQRLMLHIEQAKAEGIEIRCFQAEGNYVEEVINFTNNNRITLLISEPDSRAFRSNRQMPIDLNSLRHRVKCRMEVVTQKKPFTN